MNIDLRKARKLAMRVSGEGCSRLRDQPVAKALRPDYAWHV